LAASAIVFRVTPKHNPSTGTGDGSPRRLGFHILRRSGCEDRVAPALHGCCRASDTAPGFPQALHLPALPAINPRGESRIESFGGADGSFPGCPVQRSFGIADDQVTGFPATCIFRRQLMNLPEFPRFAHPPASPERIFGSPRIFFGLWLLRPTWRHIAMALRSFGGADGLGFGSPRNAVLRLGCRCFLESPRFAAAAGSMMNPSCPRTLHLRLAPRMNLRVQSGFAVPA